MQQKLAYTETATDEHCSSFLRGKASQYCILFIFDKYNTKVYPYLIEVWSLSPDKVTFFDWCIPPETSCKYSATAERAVTSNLRASSSHTQQWTPRRPENTHSKC
jgi:hypothetical protein